jgi:hypothetical protein
VAGVPTVILATHAFAGLAREAAESAGIAGARIASVPHPLGGVPKSLLTDRADAAVDEIVALLCGEPR